jgi:hypothetical protein
MIFPGLRYRKRRLHALPATACVTMARTLGARPPVGSQCRHLNAPISASSPMIEDHYAPAGRNKARLGRTGCTRRLHQRQRFPACTTRATTSRTPHRVVLIGGYVPDQDRLSRRARRRRCSPAASIGSSCQMATASCGHTRRWPRRLPALPYREQVDWYQRYRRDRRLSPRRGAGSELAHRR